MKRRVVSSPFLSYQVIDIVLFYKVSVKYYAFNWVSLRLDVLPKFYYSLFQSYRDLWRHR